MVKSTDEKQIDYGKAVIWFFSDPKFWGVAIKFSLLFISCIFILPLFYVVPVMLGYMLQVIRSIQKGKYELPDIGEEDQWQQGVIFALVLCAIGIVLGFAQGIISGFVTMMTALGGQRYEEARIIGMLLLLPVQLVFGLATSFITYAMYPIYAKTLNIGSMFSLENLLYVITKNIVPMIISMLVLMAVSMMFTIIGFMALCIGILPAMFAIYVVMASLLGQLDVDEVE